MIEVDVTVVGFQVTVAAVMVMAAPGRRGQEVGVFRKSSLIQRVA